VRWPGITATALDALAVKGGRPKSVSWGRKGYAAFRQSWMQGERRARSSCRSRVTATGSK
jgi:hypothetical protein